MVSIALGITAASWALVMAMAPILQIREIVRRGSSEGVSIAYFAVLIVGFWPVGCIWHREPRSAPHRPELRRVPGHGRHDRRRSTSGRHGSDAPVGAWRDTTELGTGSESDVRDRAR